MSVRFCIGTRKGFFSGYRRSVTGRTLRGPGRAELHRTVQATAYPTARVSLKIGRISELTRMPTTPPMISNIRGSAIFDTF